MQRTNLINARDLADLSQEDLAKILGVRQETVSRWETGEDYPQAYYRRKLRAILKNNDANLFDIDEDENSSISDREDEIGETTPALSREDELIEMLKPYSRREILDAFGKLPVLVGLDLNLLFSTVMVAPEELISFCQEVVDKSWELLENGEYAIANSLLTTCVSKLNGLSENTSPYQRQAATLAVTATIIQMSIATHTLNYSRRATLGLDAVRLGELSGDSNMHVVAIAWHGDTYKYCYSQPETAIATLKKALPLLRDDTVNKADILMSLAIAYAQNRNKKMARDYATEAQIAMPEYPQLDPLYRIIRTGHAELDSMEGRTYLILANQFPKGGYAKMAYDAFMKATSKQAMFKASIGQTLIRKADSLRALGDMDASVKGLTNGLLIGVETNSKKLLQEIGDVLHRLPDNWKKETAILNLQKELGHAITTTQ